MPHAWLNSFTKETRIASPGRTKGKKNRETIARRILELNAQKTITKDRWLELCERYPTLARQGVDIEEVMTTVQVAKAIFKEDSKAYELVMNMAYKPHTAHEIASNTYIFSSNLDSPYNSGVIDVEVQKPDKIAE
jgi:hypothetical protein